MGWAVNTFTASVRPKDYTKGTPEITMPIFFSHSGNTDVMKFCTRTQDSYTGSYKKFRVNSASFICV